MSAPGNAPLSDQEIDDLLDAFASFGAVHVDANQPKTTPGTAHSQGETSRGGVILRPQFGKPRS